MKREADDSFDYQSKRENIDPFENTIILKNEQPSLQHMTTVSIAINLWSEQYVTEAIEKTLQLYSSEDDCHFTYFTKTKHVYDKLHERIAKTVTQIPLPDSLKASILDVIEPIGLQLLTCFIERDIEYCNVYNIIKSGGIICWTTEGTIDKIKSLRHALNSDIGKKSFTLFKLACMFCLGEYISDLWVNVRHCKELLKMKFRYDQVIVQYWIYAQRNELQIFSENIFANDSCNVYSRDLSLHQNMVSLSMFLENIFGVKYFLKQLTEQEIQDNLENWLIQCSRLLKNKPLYRYQEYNGYTDILHTLLSHLEGDDQRKVFFLTHSREILNALFFSWPFQRFFIPTIIPVLKYLHKDVYVELMTNVVSEIKEKRMTHEIFRKIWLNTSSSLREAFLQDIPNVSKTVWQLLSIEDFKTIALILNDLSSTEKSIVMYNMAELDHKLFIFDVFYSGKVNSLETLLSKTLSSDSKIRSFKLAVFETFGESLFKYLTCHGNFAAAKHLFQWSFKEKDQFKHFIKDIDILKICSTLMSTGDYGTLDTFLTWYFDTKDKKNDFKKSLVYNETFTKCLLLELGKQDDLAWKLFEKFISYSQWSSDEIKKIKSIFLEGVKVLVRYNFLKFASKLLHWCQSSAEEERLFKNDLLMGLGVDLLVHCMIGEFEAWGKIKSIIRWFSPNNVEIVTALKNRLSACDISYSYLIPVDRKKTVLFYLLDCFIEKYNGHDSDFDFGDGRTIKKILQEYQISATCNGNTVTWKMCDSTDDEDFPAEDS